MPVLERVRAVVARIMEVPPAQVTLEKTKADFEKWDSLRHLDLIMEVEAEFACSLTMAEAASLGSVRDIVEVVRRKSI